MEYQGLTRDDLANVRALNHAWLTQAGKPERLAAAPFLLFSFRERDTPFWDRLLAAGAQRELFAGRLNDGSPLYDLQTAGLAFLWELSRRNRYAARIVSGAPLEWCERIAAATLFRVLDCARQVDLIRPRFAAEAPVYRYEAAQVVALQTLLTTGSGSNPGRLPAAACRMPRPAQRATD